MIDAQSPFAPFVVDHIAVGKEHVVHVHFKDMVLCPKGPNSRSALDGKFYDPAELMGEGIVDFRACLQAMEDDGYEGYVDFEYEGSKYTPFDAARKGIPYLRELYGLIHRKKIEHFSTRVVPAPCK